VSTTFVRQAAIPIVYGLNRLLSVHKLIYLYAFISPFLIFGFEEGLNKVRFALFYVLGGAIVVSWGVLRVRSLDFSLRHNKYIIILLLLFSFAFVSAYVTSGIAKATTLYGATSLEKIWDVIRIITVTYCCYDLLDYSGFLRLLKAFYYSFLPAIIGVFHRFIILGSDYSPTKTRLTSFIHDPNVFGHYLVLIVLMSLLFFVREKRANGHNALRYKLIGFSALGLLFHTYSRGSFLMLGMLATVLLIMDKKGDIRRRILPFMGIGILAFSIMVFLRMQTRELGSTVLSDMTRLSLNMAAFNMIKEHFWFGVGYENARYLIRDYTHPDYPIVSQGIVSIHNVYIKLFAELGVIGVGLFTAFGVLLLKDIYQNIKNSTQTVRPLFLFLLVLHISYVVHGMVYHYYFHYHVFWILTIVTLLALRYKGKLDTEFAAFRL